MKMIKYLLFFMMVLVSPNLSAEGKFLLLLGPSGVGKSTIIHHLKEMDSRFVYISPYTTRALREGETDKVHVTLEVIEDLEKQNRLLTINNIYGVYYATPKDPIDEALSLGMFPVLDWPVEKMDVMQENYKDNLYTIYLEPESLDELSERLAKDGRDKNGLRFKAGKLELENYYSGKYDQLLDLRVVNKNGEDKELSLEIYEKFIQAF